MTAYEIISIFIGILALLEEYRKMSKPQQDSIKDVGGFVAGHPAFWKQMMKFRCQIVMRKRRKNILLFRVIRNNC